MDRDQFERFYWNYYLLLENKFMATTSFVYLSEDNFETYSFEYVHLLLSICAALENTLQAFENYPSGKWDKIRSFLNGNFKESPPVIAVKDHPEILLRPFPKASEDEKLVIPWWDAYNNIKHNWVHNLKSANMGCTINALAALFTICMVFIKTHSTTDVDIPLNGSPLFILKNMRFKAMPADKLFTTISELNIPNQKLRPTRAGATQTKKISFVPDQ